MTDLKPGSLAWAKQNYDEGRMVCNWWGTDDPLPFNPYDPGYAELDSGWKLATQQEIDNPSLYIYQDPNRSPRRFA